jgi:effector-binding domain-containing protein
MTYADANDLGLGHTMWERYMTDPAVETDPNKYVTEIYWLIA